MGQRWRKKSNTIFFSFLITIIPASLTPKGEYTLLSWKSQHSPYNLIEFLDLLIQRGKKVRGKIRGKVRETVNLGFAPMAAKKAFFIYNTGALRYVENYVSLWYIMFVMHIHKRRYILTFYFSLSTYLFVYLSMFDYVRLSVYLSLFYLSIDLLIYLSVYLECG